MKVGIIGSGPGGMITAMVLAQRGIHVTLFEKGKHYVQGAQVPFSIAEMEQKYTDGGMTVALGSPKVSYVEGSCLGGGSEVNAGLYHEVPPEVFDRWSLTTLDYTTFQKHAENCRKLVNVCAMPFEAPAASRKLAEGAEKLGWQCVQVPRWYRYTSTTDRGIYSGIRQSMTETVLPQLPLPTTTILTQATVQKLQKQTDGTVGVRYQTPEGTKTAFFDAVFVASGAIGTPYLLQRSGLGNATVGKSLRMHPTIKITAEFPDAINHQNAGVGVHQVKEFAPDFSFGCAISSLPYLASGLTSTQMSYTTLMEKWPHLSTYYAMTEEGIGQVHALPFIDRPIVRFQLGKAGLQKLSGGVRQLSALLLAAGATRLYPSSPSIHHIERMEDWASYPECLPAEDMHLMTVHLMGSCPMGEDSQRHTVDETGKLYGEKNLYIADASILPSALGVNPQGTIMALCHRNAEIFATHHGY